MRQASSRRLVKFHSCVVEIRNSWLLEIPQRHFLEGAKDRERRVRLAASECLKPWKSYQLFGDLIFVFIIFLQVFESLGDEKEFPVILPTQWADSLQGFLIFSAFHL